MDIVTIFGELASATSAPRPSIECWIPTRGASGAGLLIFPGGGYGNLAEHEGRGYAEYFSAQGIACFVVNYRLGTQGFRHPAMLEDALAALYAVRSRAAEFAIDPHKIGVMGSSAGGHLAAHVLVAWSEYESEVSLRPDFGVLCYPVICSRPPHAHTGSMRNLAGEDIDAALLDALSCEKRVSAQTPPCFIWHTGDDAAVPVENSMLFATALRAQQVPFELHVYAQGRHGLGLEAPFAWGADCLRWMGETL